MKSQVHLLQEPLKSKGTCVPNADVEMTGDLGVTQGSMALPTVMFLEADYLFAFFKVNYCVYTCVCVHAHCVYR